MPNTVCLFNGIIKTQREQREIIRHNLSALDRKDLAQEYLETGQLLEMEVRMDHVQFCNIYYIL